MQSPPPRPDLHVSEHELDHFDAGRRAAALKRLLAVAERDSSFLPPPSGWVNHHSHTIFSYNAYGYSPTGFAWRARVAGLDQAGIVDFDTLDGIEEFRSARQALGLKGFGSIETRVFVPEFADLEMSSPGEPGITYHMGIGMPRGEPSAEAQPFLDRLARTARERNLDLIARVNGALAPVTLDYDADVVPLTPAGNATERHICHAWNLKARARFPDDADLLAYWNGTLGTAWTEVPGDAELEKTLRAKTMKEGGVGYVRPGPDTFPPMAEFNAFVATCGGLPCLAWLDGRSAGERDPGALLDNAMASGTVAVNIIPDRNYVPGERNELVENLQAFVAAARTRHLPIIAGTEMNAPGNKFVDDFASAELAPLLPEFRRGGHIVYAHSVLERAGGLGWLSPWARRHFPDPAARNAWYEQAGQRLDPRREPESLAEADPSEMLERLA